MKKPTKGLLIILAVLVLAFVILVTAEWIKLERGGEEAVQVREISTGIK